MVSPDLESSQLAETVSLEHDFASVGGDFVVVATQGRHDRTALKAAINSNAGYIGMVASRKKIAGLKASLIKSGNEAGIVERIHSPVGIEIGAVTPAEIALSVLADLVRARRGEKIAPQPANVVAEAVAGETGGSCCGG